MINHAFVNKKCFAIEKSESAFRVFSCRIERIKIRGSGLRCLVEELDENGEGTFAFHIRYDFELYETYKSAILFSE